jgi:RNA polymerase sigma factor (sigma-70 family)
VGDEQSEFAEFYQTSRDPCLRAVTASVGDRQLAEDLVAEAFVRAWVAWRKVRRHPAPRAWVVRTAVNNDVSLWRARRREIPLAGQDAAAPANLDDGVDAALIGALRRLPARQRKVITLRVLLDLDTDTTAKVLRIAPGTVTAHLSRAVAALRRDLLPANTPANAMEGRQRMTRTYCRRSATPCPGSTRTCRWMRSWHGAAPADAAGCQRWPERGLRQAWR